MKYNIRAFNSAVKEYENQLKELVKQDRVVMVISELSNRAAFYSIAPLSRAVHNLGGEIHVTIKEGHATNLEILFEVWKVYHDHKRKIKTAKVKALMKFIRAVDKRTGVKTFRELFREPEIVLRADEKGFKGTIELPFKAKWFKKYRWNELKETAGRIWNQGYDIKKGEKVGVNMEMVPMEADTELPLEDYLDSYSISLAMAVVAKKLGAKVGIGGSTNKFSSLANAERVGDLMSTLIGCELDKEVDEEVFKVFREFSKVMKLNRLKTNDALFGIHGKGYGGKLFFGSRIGYPSLDKKTRWPSPGAMLLKDRFSPQAALESRPPKMRYGITETLPLDIFIETCNIDYFDLKKRSDRVRDVFNKCSHIRVIGKEIDGYKTDLRVNLLTPKMVRREFTSSDCDVRTVVDQEHLKKTGMETGTFANFPSGEAFVTPESVFGTLVGDVVISIDQSHILPSPLIIAFTEKGYKIVNGPKKIVDKMKEERRDARKRILDYEKNNSLPKEIIKTYKRNFNGAGEFAVNTNPKAKLCDYLIVNEKIARMIHVALGSGFEPDKKTVYHWDIVVDSPRQKLDVYGVDEKKKIHWVIKKGKLLV